MRLNERYRAWGSFQQASRRQVEPISQCTVCIYFYWEKTMARLTRWGNSDGGLRIPKPILEAAGLRVGDEIGCRLLDNGTIVLTPRKERIDISEEQVGPLNVSTSDVKW